MEFYICNEVLLLSDFIKTLMLYILTLKIFIGLDHIEISL